MATTDDVLNAVFRFRFRRPSTVQTAQFCKTLVEMVDDVVCEILALPAAEGDGDAVMDDDDDDDVDVDEATMHLDPLVHDRDVPLDEFTASDRVFLERARRQYNGRAVGAEATPVKGEMWTETWFPEYASALQMTCVSVGRVALRLVALDGWTRVVHFLPGGECVHSAVPECHDVLHCGELTWDKYGEFAMALTKELNAAKERAGNKRHATLGDGLGHQKTPAFLCACIRTALSGGRGSSKPNGGTTDVGMHTGGQPSDTCWPLVRSVLKQALPGSSGMFEKVLLQLECKLLQTQVDRLSVLDDAKDFWVGADMAFAMLQNVVTIAAGMIDRGYTSAQLERDIGKWRKLIDARVQKWSDHPRRAYDLPGCDALANVSASVKTPVLRRPDLRKLIGGDDGFKSGRERALAENHGYEVVDALVCSPQVLLDYLRMAAASGIDDQVIVGQQMVETFMYRLAAELSLPAAVTVCEPSALLEITTWYRVRRARFGATHKFDQVARVKTDSELLLLSWIAFCLCHKTCCALYEWLQQHKIALDWRRLSVVVLPHKSARTALQKVASYLRRWNTRSGLLSSVFNFNDPEGTIQLARTMGQRLSVYTEMYERHISSRDQHLATMWAAIEQRKRRVASLRGDLADERPRLERAQAQLRSEQSDIDWNKSRGKYVSYHELNRLQERVQQLNNSVRDKEDEVGRLLKCREFFISPLPIDKIEALAVLFLNYLPPHLDILAELCGLAQRELGPIDSQKYRVSPPCSTSWASHTASYGRSCFIEAPTKHMSEYPHALDVPSQYGPQSIDDLSSQVQFSRVCAWYPSGNNNQILWKEPSGAFVDPFKIPKRDSILHFTTKLTSEMEWAMAYPGGSTRGNIAFAKAGVIAAANDDFTAYVTLGSLRCYPTQQLRRLFEAIQTSSLDWSAHLVAVVVKHAAFQVGALTDDAVPLFAWHPDLDRAAPLEEFRTMIENLAKHVASSPNSWTCIPLLGEVAGFLDQFERHGRAAVRSLSGTARHWAQEHRKKWLGGVPTDERIELRTHECLLYGFALTCYSFGPCSKEDLLSICELLILFANAALFATGALRGDVREVERVVHRVMSARIVTIVEMVASSASETLSHLCGLVNEDILVGLQWFQVAARDNRLPCCFEAIDEEHGVHYLVNIFTGSILTNGMPPGGLPASIRKHKQFVVLFGDQDFEVIRRDDAYSTAQKLGDCAYSFRLVDDSLLVVETSSMARLQTCSDAWLASFGSIFPATVSQLYSHWYWEEHDCVLLRQKLVAKREVLFVVKFKKGRAFCYEVPRGDLSLAYAAIVSLTASYSVLVLHDDAVSRVFSKFEDLPFVHVMLSAAKRLEIFLPRYGLRFVQDDCGRLNSKGYRGYCLSSNQRLSGQMHRFQRYLVLESESLSCEKFPRRVLIPCGRVVGLENGEVDIERPTCADASLSLCVVEEHPRLLTFSAEPSEHRLLLAAIYAACDNLVPWKDLQMTGGQAANDLLRGSTSSRPFSDTATAALRDICGFSHLTTTLKLKVNELESKALQRTFLFPEASQSPVASGTVGELDAYAVACRRTSAHEYHLRGSMALTEECCTLGSSVLRVPKASFRDTLRAPVELCEVPVESDFVRDVETTLLQFVEPLRPKSVPSFPLATLALNALGNDMVDELKESWSVHHCEPEQALAVDYGVMSRESRTQLTEVVKRRAMVWAYLCCAVLAARASPKEKILASVQILPTFTKTDVLRIVLDKATLLHFTSAFSEQSRARFTEAALRFMELCVLEEKLERIISRAEAKTPPPAEYFVEELTCVRHWKTDEYPFWLVFEVEGRVQIRPEQYIVALHLIQNPGSICQLNMGRGKTRVILPMLFLYFRYKVCNSVVRAHFLAPLLSETRQFMHRVLSAGSLRLPFVELPFNRTVELGVREVLLMQEAVDEVKRHGGFVIVAPEHRLSLELKRREIQRSDIADKKAICTALDALLDGIDYIDIFDESDAVLHHKYHLVYAVGSTEVLDSGSCRWITAEALIRVLTSPTSERVTAVLTKFPALFSVRTEYDQRRGAFNGFTLSTALEPTSMARVALTTALIEDLIDHAPFDLSWLSVIAQRSQTLRAYLVAALTDCQVDSST